MMPVLLGAPQPTSVHALKEPASARPIHDQGCGLEKLSQKEDEPNRTFPSPVGITENSKGDESVASCLRGFCDNDTFAPVDLLRARSRGRSTSPSAHTDASCTNSCGQGSRSQTPSSSSGRRRSGSFNSMSKSQQDQLQNLIKNYTAHTVPDTPTIIANKPKLNKKANSVIILDWDDTLFPTTWIRQDVGLDWSYPVEAQINDMEAKNMLPKQAGVSTGPLILKLLERHNETVTDFLYEAFSLAKVYIVTLAKPGWVEAALANFLPNLSNVLSENSVKVIYAQHHCDDLAVSKMEYQNFKSIDEACEFWSKVKERAILTQLMASGVEDGQRWDTLVSVGDSDFERVGSISAGKEYMNAIHFKESSAENRESNFRIKTFKMVPDPTVEELTAQLILLKSWLPFIMANDKDLDLEIENTEDDDKLADLHKQLTGEDLELRWVELAGMAD